MPPRTSGKTHDFRGSGCVGYVLKTCLVVNHWMDEISNSFLYVNETRIERKTAQETCSFIFNRTTKDDLLSFIYLFEIETAESIFTIEENDAQ